MEYSITILGKNLCNSLFLSYNSLPGRAFKNRERYICIKYPDKFSEGNKMVPKPIPEELKDLTSMEEIYISRISQQFKIWYVK